MLSPLYYVKKKVKEKKMCIGKYNKKSDINVLLLWSALNIVIFEEVFCDTSNGLNALLL